MYSRISFSRFFSSVRSCVFAEASRLQLAPFQVFEIVPSPEIALTSPSSVEPSPLQTGIGFAITIQFPPCINGESPFPGLPPIVLAGPPKHIPTPIPRVNVGVTKRRIKLVGESTPRYPPAPVSAVQLPTYRSGDAGQTVGT